LGCGYGCGEGGGKMNRNIKNHPIADLFPMIEGDEFTKFADNIEQAGLMEDIVLYEDMILDGRNRYKACCERGVAITTTVYAGDDPVNYVLSHNLHRRHLTPSQKAMIATSALPLFEAEARKRQVEGGRLKEVVAPMPQASTKSRDQVAKLFGVSPRLVTDAKLVANTDPELAAKVRSGELYAGEAARFIRDSKKPKQPEVDKAIATNLPTMPSEMPPTPETSIIPDSDFDCKLYAKVSNKANRIAYLMRNIGPNNYQETVNESKQLLNQIEGYIAK